MGRKTKYDNGIYSNNSEHIESKDIEVIKSKIGKESLTTEEIAVYLTECGNIKTFTKKTVENHINKICNDSNGLISKQDFMDDKGYIIKPELHGLLLTILNTNYFDGRKNQRLLGYREDLYSDIIKNIDIYLKDEEREMIKESPMYINALLESELTKKLNKELIILTRELYHSDPLVRFRMMKYVIEEISRLRKWISSTDAKIMAGKLVYSSQAEIDSETEEGKYLKEIIRSDSLEEYIIKLLVQKVCCKNKNEENNNNEIIRYPGVYFAQILYDMDVENNSDASKKLLEIDRMISDNDKFCEIITKAKEILNLEDNYESIIFENLVELCKIYFIAPAVSTKDYINIVKFTESAMAKDKWDMLREFNKI